MCEADGRLCFQKRRVVASQILDPKTCTGPSFRSMHDLACGVLWCGQGLVSYGVLDAGKCRNRNEKDHLPPEQVISKDNFDRVWRCARQTPCSPKSNGPARTKPTKCQTRWVSFFKLDISCLLSVLELNVCMLFAWSLILSCLVLFLLSAHSGRAFSGACRSRPTLYRAERHTPVGRVLRSYALDPIRGIVRLLHTYCPSSTIKL